LGVSERCHGLRSYLDGRGDGLVPNVPTIAEKGLPPLILSSCPVRPVRKPGTLEG
jgi:hypothetical protein